jgi:uncharacterized protein
MRWLALFLIRLYQRTISRVLPPSCRFVPSCSEYGYEAIARYGVVRGGTMAIWRVMRCNPWGGHGYDPVPDITKRAGGSGQQAAGKNERPETKMQDSGPEDDRQATFSQSSCPPYCPEGTRSPQSYTNFALTPHAPGHSLTEG